MRSTPPEGFGIKDKVTFDQLPERIQEFYPDPRPVEKSLWLKGTRAVLMFFPQPPHAPWIDFWEKTKNGWGFPRDANGVEIWEEHYSRNILREE